MPGLIVLDLMLPDIDGIEVCKRIRQTSDVPILMLTARDEDVDKIIGLEVGADDYLTKPFNPRELVARVKSILRRSTPDRREHETEMIDHGDLHVDAGRREVRVGDDEIQLAPKEFDLLWELLDHRGLVLTRDQLLERVWGYTFAGDTRTVDVHVRQLRRKLGDASPIVTVWGVGYKVSPAKDAQQGHGEDVGFAHGDARLAARPAAARSSSRASCSRASSRRLIAVRLFQNFAHDQALTELSREAHGIAQLYSAAVPRATATATSRESTDRRRRSSPQRASSRRPATRSTSSGRNARFPARADRGPEAAAAEDDRLARRAVAARSSSPRRASVASTWRSRTRSSCAAQSRSARSSSRRRRRTSATACSH